MANVKLEMDFLDALNKNYRISINDPRSDVTDTEVFAVMDQLLTANVFKSNNGDLIAKVAARVVTTDVEEMEV
ncbi:MAG: DUF2922 domain-containing protein [Gudongella sp.]|nr:DUF2922 domain-containing protein [Gudongella sp.]